MRFPGVGRATSVPSYRTAETGNLAGIFWVVCGNLLKRCAKAHNGSFTFLLIMPAERSHVHWQGPPSRLVAP